MSVVVRIYLFLSLLTTRLRQILQVKPQEEEEKQQLQSFLGAVNVYTLTSRKKAILPTLRITGNKTAFVLDVLTLMYYRIQSKQQVSTEFVL